MKKTFLKYTMCVVKPRTLLFLLFSLLTLNISAQGIDFGKDSPLRKLQIAEMAITNLYVDTVDEKKLVEDGIRGMIEKLYHHSAYTTAAET